MLVSEPLPLSMEPLRFCSEERPPLFRGDWLPSVPPWSRRGGAAVRLLSFSRLCAVDSILDIFYFCVCVRACVPLLFVLSDALLLNFTAFYFLFLPEVTFTLTLYFLPYNLFLLLCLLMVVSDDGYFIC